jgi:signal transduction histidine kinase
LEPPDLPNIAADRLSLTRVFRNLVDNALKYGGEKLSTIKFEYRKLDDFHVISVEDDGVGIEGELSEKIFEPLYRNSNVKDIKGFGLGLAIVSEIAEKHKGKVWLDPLVSKGTKFHFSISENVYLKDSVNTEGSERI